MFGVGIGYFVCVDFAGGFGIGAAVACVDGDVDVVGVIIIAGVVVLFYAGVTV